MSDKYYADVLNLEASNLEFLKTYSTEFDDIIVSFTEQNGRLLEIEEKVNLTLLIWTFVSQEIYLTNTGKYY